MQNLQQNISQAKKELSELQNHEDPLPEFINTTNTLRANEFLVKEIEKQRQILSLYEQYSKELERLVLNAASIKLQISELKFNKRNAKPKSKTAKRKTPNPRAKPKRRSAKRKKTKPRAKRRSIRSKSKTRKRR